MPLDLTAATARLSREMNQSETVISDALVAATALMHSAALANRDLAPLPTAKVQSALLHMSKMVAALVEVRSEAIRAHGQLSDIGREMGATEVPFCPSRASADTEDRQAA